MKLNPIIGSILAPQAPIHWLVFAWRISVHVSNADLSNNFPAERHVTQLHAFPSILTENRRHHCFLKARWHQTERKEDENRRERRAGTEREVRPGPRPGERQEVSRLMHPGAILLTSTQAATSVRCRPKTKCTRKRVMKKRALR